MDSFSPEFSAYWLREPVEATEHTGKDGTVSEQALFPSQEAALQELADLVNAARSIA